MIPLLIEAADAMDDLFWRQAYGSKEDLLASISDSDLRRFSEINYGPWDRADGDAPFIDGVGPKPMGAGFYPTDMTKKELEAAASEDPEKGEALKSLVSVKNVRPHHLGMSTGFSPGGAAPVSRHVGIIEFSSALP